MKILIAVDGSEYTTKAVKFVTSHLNWFKNDPELHVLHVQLPIPEAPARAALGREAVENYYKEESLEALAPAEKLLRESGIPFKSGYSVGDIAEQIQGYARQYEIDMIVMGSHGRGALKNLVMGSIAAKVLATATVPVLIVR